MCGIVGYVGHRPALDFLVEGLSKLEYRGYDSAGVCVIENGTFVVVRALGKLTALRGKLDSEQSARGGLSGIGHTRWATHGRPSETNAHPHTHGRVSLIHNGIIENYLELRAGLEAHGHTFHSETDSEIVAHMLHNALSTGVSAAEAIESVCSEIEGSYALVALDCDNPEQLIVAKSSSPLVIGLGDGEIFVASDIPALLERTRKVVFLEDGDSGVVSCADLSIRNGGRFVERHPEVISWDPVTAQKGGYKHFMLKEIHEQPRVLADTFRSRLDLSDLMVRLPEFTMSDDDIRGLSRIQFVGCGTAWHAALVMRYFIERCTNIVCDVDYASEFRYRDVVLPENSLFACVSQSGETADTLAALQRVRSQVPTLAICNVVGSSIARAVESLILTHAGPEISVASTKAFTTQLVSGLLLATSLGQKRGTVTEEQRAEIVQSLMQLPQLFEAVLESESEIQQIASRFSQAKDFLFLGRGVCYPIALEGALKLKEISYIHAEGYPAGEMKHGPIALVDEFMPVVFVVQRSSLALSKTLSNLREVEARRGRIIVVTDAVLDADTKGLCEAVIEVPFLSEYLSPLALTVPLQLLAYHVAVERGTDVDLPRNLAKSVTVE